MRVGQCTNNQQFAALVFPSEFIRHRSLGKLLQTLGLNHVLHIPEASLIEIANYNSCRQI